MARLAWHELKRLRPRKRYDGTVVGEECPLLPALFTPLQ